jgi:hypothetical protein
VMLRRLCLVSHEPYHQSDVGIHGKRITRYLTSMALYAVSFVKYTSTRVGHTAVNHHRCIHRNL